MINKTFQITMIIVFFSSLLILPLSFKETDEGRFIRISEQYPRYFETSDGKAWIPVMINFLMPNGEEAEVFGTVEKYFKNFSENGGNVARIWISSPFLEIEDEQIGKYNPVKFERIDRLLNIAEKYNIRIKFTLQHIRSISAEETRRNSWSNRAYLSVARGGIFQDIKEYINSDQGKSAYLDRVKAFSERYKNNDQIFGWELWNEMDAVDENDWFQFSAEILDSVKVLFPNHSVVQTLGSLHSKDAGERYDKMLSLKNNEYIPVHRYLDPGTDWNQYDLVRDPIDMLASNAVQFVYREDIVKPVWVNEIGAVEGNHSGPSKLYAKDSLGVLIHDMIFAPYFCGAAGCGAMWHWNVYIERQNLWFQYKRFTNVIRDFDPIEEQFFPFSLQKDPMRLYGLRGFKSTLIWCRDTRNNWETELEDGVQPEINSNLTFDLTEIAKGDFENAKVYDPWNDSWTELTIQNDHITLPPFARSIVVILQ